MKPYRAIIFDLYQTLLYAPHTGTRERAIELAISAGVSREAWLRAWRETREEAMRGRIPTVRARARAALAVAGLPEAGDELVDGIAGLLVGRHFPVVYADVRPTLRELGGRGYRLGLITNLESDWQPWVAQLELSEFMDAAVHSCDVGMAKPEPEIYLRCAEQLGVPARECAFVDDQPEYLAGAQAVGMAAVLIDRPGRADPLPQDQAFDLRIEGLSALLEWLPQTAPEEEAR
jgi:putative hydrolase of the HAD superfamily